MIFLLIDSVEDRLRSAILIMTFYGFSWALIM